MQTKQMKMRKKNRKTPIKLTKGEILQKEMLKRTNIMTDYRMKKKTSEKTK